jgi:hypothetical protein
MRGQAGFWDVDERYELLSEAGDPLERLNGVGDVPQAVVEGAEALGRVEERPPVL